MAHQNRFKISPKAAAASPPGRDDIMRQQAAQFPQVGMTFSSYTGDTAMLGVQSGALAASKVTPKARGRWRRIFKAITLKRVVIGLALIVLLVGGWLGYKFVYNAHKVFGGNILSVLSTTKLKGEDAGRVNILLAGNSADDVGHNGGELTDSIMIMSIDTRAHKAFMLSVPRDLWVAIPDSGHQKINYAYVAGENNDFSQSGYPKGGMGQLEQVIEENFGISINYYALVDYNALKEAVNAVGGVDFTVASTDKRGLYDPSIDWTTKGPLVKLTNGTHHLNGQQALDLARARGDAYGSYGFPQSDFDRTSNQRQLLLALKNKAVSAGVISNPAKLSSLSDAIGGNVKTDFTLSEVHRLYDIVKDINSNNIQSISLNSVKGKNLLANYAAPNGTSALIPAAGLDDFGDIQTFIKQATSSDPLVQESATIVLLNGTDTTGLANRQRNILTGKNITIATIGDSASKLPITSIIDTTGGKMPATLKALKAAFPKATVTATNPYAGSYNADIIVVLGNDALPTTTGSSTGTAN